MDERRGGGGGGEENKEEEGTVKMNLQIINVLFGV